MKKYSLSWFYATGKSWAKDDKKYGIKRRFNYALGNNKIQKLAFKLGYLLKG